jgi:hypothetical protein
MYNSEWNICQFGTDTARHYAIRWTAAQDIWHRFYLLAPSEGGGWIPHRPGDACPCQLGSYVDLLWDDGDSFARQHMTGPRVFDKNSEGIQSVIGWRPALAEVSP